MVESVSKKELPPKWYSLNPQRPKMMACDNNCEECPFCHKPESTHFEEGLKDTYGKPLFVPCEEFKTVKIPEDDE